MAKSKRPEVQAVYECDRCGACCRHLLLDGSEEDAIREPRIAALPQLRDPDGIAYSLQPDCEASYTSDGHYNGHPCHFLGCDNLCTIYSTRPSMCAAFEAGGDKCQSARETAGLPPLEPVHGQRRFDFKPLPGPTYLNSPEGDRALLDAILKEQFSARP
jgi:Fe-S-cluster containining protein